MVEGACLENRCAGNRTGGSNPFLSANDQNRQVMEAREKILLSIVK